MVFRYLAYLYSLFNRDTTNTGNDCNPSSLFELKSVKIMPDPLIVGQHMTMTVIFQNDYDYITDGIQRMKVNFNGMSIPVPDEQLCLYNEELCPIKLGLHALNHTFVIPNVPGTVDMKLAWYTTGGGSLLCTHAQFEIVDSPQQPSLRHY
jgi:hypothetical protein